MFLARLQTVCKAGAARCHEQTRSKGGLGHLAPLGCSCDGLPWGLSPDFPGSGGHRVLEYSPYIVLLGFVSLGRHISSP